MDATMKKMLERLVIDFNNYSELVALNYEYMKEKKCGEEILQWNRGELDRIEQYMQELAGVLHVNLEYRCSAHLFEYDDWARNIEYRTAHIVE